MERDQALRDRDLIRTSLADLASGILPPGVSLLRLRLALLPRRTTRDPGVCPIHIPWGALPVVLGAKLPRLIRTRGRDPLRQ